MQGELDKLWWSIQVTGDNNIYFAGGEHKSFEAAKLCLKWTLRPSYRKNTPTKFKIIRFETRIFEEDEDYERQEKPLK